MTEQTVMWIVNSALILIVGYLVQNWMSQVTESIKQLREDLKKDVVEINDALDKKLDSFLCSERMGTLKSSSTTCKEYVEKKLDDLLDRVRSLEIPK